MRWMLICAVLFLPATSHGQDIAELARRNGFKDIKLGSPVDSVKGAVFVKDMVELKEFDTKLYNVKNPAYEKIGDVNVISVQLKVYNGLIYQIIVTTPKDPRIMKGLEKSYGKATYSIRTESYYWRVPEEISLVYKGGKKDVVLTYHAYPMVKIMYGDKKKKIEEVADDF